MSVSEDNGGISAIPTFFHDCCCPPISIGEQHKKGSSKMLEPLISYGAPGAIRTLDTRLRRMPFECP